MSFECKCCNAGEINRTLQKRVDNLNNELYRTKNEYKEFRNKAEQKEAAYQKSSELIQFYQNYIDIAAGFPTDKNDVCKWIEDNYCNDLIVTPRASNELRKHSGPLDIAYLCDGIVFLFA